MKSLVALLLNFLQTNICNNMLFLSSIIFILAFFFFRHFKAPSNLPPSPPKLPIIGNLHQLGSLPHRSLGALSKKYGPVMLLQIGCVPTIIISSAQMACEVMKTQDIVFASRPRLSIPRKLLYDCDIAFAPCGEHWRQMRKICVVHLLSIKMVQSFRSVREEEVSLMISKIRSSQQNSVNLSELFTTLICDIICRVALGKKYYKGVGGVNKMRHMLGEFRKLLGALPIRDLFPWLAWLDHLSGLNARVKRNSKEWDDFLEAILNDHLQAKRDESNNHKENGDFVDVLLTLNEDNESECISFSRDNIKALIMDMFAGGTDTTFLTLEWAMAELIRNPKVMERVQEEVRRVVGCNQKISDGDVDKMIYLKAVIKETLRLRPAAPLLVPREAMNDTKLDGFHIPRGTRVMVNAWAIGRDPTSWDRPEEFCPDRFISSNVDFKGQDFHFIPFGAGRRMCPGASFAISTVELALSHLLHHFDWQIPRGMEGEVLDMSEAPGFTTHKKSGLLLIAKPLLFN